MTEYVPKEAAKDVINHNYPGFWAAIDALPAADVVPVVRCKDCRYFRLNMESDPYCGQRNGLSDPTPSSFCSWGEHKEDAND